MWHYLGLSETGEADPAKRLVLADAGNLGHFTGRPRWCSGPKPAEHYASLALSLCSATLASVSTELYPFKTCVHLNFIDNT